MAGVGKPAWRGLRGSGDGRRAGDLRGGHHRDEGDSLLAPILSIPCATRRIRHLTAAKGLARVTHELE